MVRKTEPQFSLPEDFAMKYAVMHRGHMVLRTNDIDVARRKLDKIGGSSYIVYSQKGREEYMAEKERESANAA